MRHSVAGAGEQWWASELRLQVWTYWCWSARPSPPGRRAPSACTRAASRSSTSAGSWIDKPWPEGLDTAHGYVFGIPQPATERLLAERAAELGAEVRRGCEAVGIRQDEDGVTVDCVDGTRERGRVLVGCDGGRSTARRIAGINFPGEPAQTEHLLGEMQVETPAEEIAAVVGEVRRTHRDVGVGPSGNGLFRVVVPAPSLTR